uniref:Uncharacterized protein n=1 Tax=Tetranychus urticae TaxID=32264 RepID=T1K6P4_TETUR
MNANLSKKGSYCTRLKESKIYPLFNSIETVDRMSYNLNYTDPYDAREHKSVALNPDSLIIKGFCGRPVQADYGLSNKLTEIEPIDVAR